MRNNSQKPRHFYKLKKSARTETFGSKKWAGLGQRGRKVAPQNMHSQTVFRPNNGGQDSASKLSRNRSSIAGNQDVSVSLGTTQRHLLQQCRTTRYVCCGHADRYSPTTRHACCGHADRYSPTHKVLQKLTAPRLLKKFPAFYATHKFVTALTQAR